MRTGMPKRASSLAMVRPTGPAPEISTLAICLAPLSLECLQLFQHLVDMARHLHLVPDLGHRARLVDQEGRPLDAHVLAAIEALLDPGAVLLADLAVLVGH